MTARRTLTTRSLGAFAVVSAISLSCFSMARVQHAAAPAAPLPGESLYQLPIRILEQRGVEMRLDALRGKPTIITMFYTSCDGICPMIAFSMRRMERALTAQQRVQLQWVMVSFDPERDSPDALRRFARLNQLDRPGWSLARTSDSSVQELAAALGIRYRKLPGGDFSHSTELILLDAQGVPRARTSNLNELDLAFMTAVRKELR